MDVCGQGLCGPLSPVLTFCGGDFVKLNLSRILPDLYDLIE